VKHTKKIGKVVTLTVLTVVVLFYLLPNVAFIEQSLDIRATPDKVFELINRPENWTEWYTPLLDTSGVRVRFVGTSEGKGAGMKWISNHPKTSAGIMNIRNSKNNRNVTAEVTINERRSAVMNFKIRPVGIDASMLTVTSRLRFRQDSLLHYLRLMFDRSDELAMIGYLENIDDAAIGKTGGIDVHLQRIETFSYISIVDSCAWQDMPQLMKDSHNELLVFGAKSGIDMTGRPIAVYHKFDEKQVVLESGIPVHENVQVSGRIRYKTMPGGNHAVANYYGSYDTLEDGHNAIQQWLIRYRRKMTGPPWETFVTDPAAESDPNRWLTRIYYPVD
jgi:effector-binding domain-containing protein